MIHNRFLAAAALAVLAPAGAAMAQTAVVNKAVTETEVLAAQRAWCDALVNISRTGESQGRPRPRPLPSR